MKENKDPGRLCGSPGGQQLSALIWGSKIQFLLSPHGLGNSRWPHWLAEFGLLHFGNRTKHINFSGRQEIRRVSDGHEQIAIIKHKPSLTQQIRTRAILQVRYPGRKHSVAGRSNAGGAIPASIAEASGTVCTRAQLVSFHCAATLRDSAPLSMEWNLNFILRFDAHYHWASRVFAVGLPDLASLCYLQMTQQFPRRSRPLELPIWDALSGFSFNARTRLWKPSLLSLALF